LRTGCCGDYLNLRGILDTGENCIMWNFIICTIYQTKQDEMGGAMRTMRILVGKPERKRPLGRARSRCENNIKMDLRDTWWVGVVWIHLARKRAQWRTLVNSVMTLRVP
jgi:hypothetical protein